jgi:hypothetical protein
LRPAESPLFFKLLQGGNGFFLRLFVFTDIRRGAKYFLHSLEAKLFLFDVV